MVPAALSTVPLDVYAHILSFLPRSALAALMRTCRSLLSDTTPILYARASRHPFSELYRLQRFHVFLRVGSEDSRVEFVRDLHLSVRKLLTVGKSEEDYTNRMKAEYAASMLVMVLHTILPSCFDLRLL